MLRRKFSWVFNVFFIIAILEGSMALSSEISGEPAWKLSIALPESNRARALQFSLSEHFHVVLENISREPQRIWKHSNSWGYSILYFEMTNKIGKKYVIRKSPRDWRKNSPQYWSILPGEYLVYNVSLTDKDWNVKLPNSSQRGFLKIQAILDVSDDDQAREHDVPAGLIKSVVYEITHEE